MYIINSIKRFDIVEVELIDDGSVIQNGTRPCIVVSNNKINSGNSVCIVVPVTTGKKCSNKYKSHFEFDDIYCKGTALCEQMRAIPVNWILYKRGKLSNVFHHKFIEVLKFTLGIKSKEY